MFKKLLGNKAKNVTEATKGIGSSIGEIKSGVIEVKDGMKKLLEEIQEENNVIGINTFAFMSLNNGAGCKTILSQVAHILSEQNYKVGILDCDFIQPGMGFMFNTPVTKEMSVLNYFNSSFEIMDSLIKIKESKNAWLVSTSPLDIVVDMVNIDKEMMTELVMYMKESFDYLLINLPYNPTAEWFYRTVPQVDKGYIIWDEQTDNIIKTKSMLDHINYTSFKANNINNVIINKATSYAFDYDKITEVECMFISELPYIKEMSTMKNEGKNYMAQKSVDKEYLLGFQRIIDDMLKY